MKECFTIFDSQIHVLGSNVRVDTTLLGFQNMRWQRGHQSFLFFTDGMNIVLCMSHPLLGEFISV